MTLDRVHLFLPGTCTTEDKDEFVLTLNTARHSPRENREPVLKRIESRMLLYAKPSFIFDCKSCMQNTSNTLSITTLLYSVDCPLLDGTWSTLASTRMIGNPACSIALIQLLH